MGKLGHASHLPSFPYSMCDSLFPHLTPPISSLPHHFYIPRNLHHRKRIKAITHVNPDQKKEKKQTKCDKVKSHAKF